MTVTDSGVVVSEGVAASTSYADLVLSELCSTIDVLRALPGQDWWRPTRCARWSVRRLAVHLAKVVPSHAEICRRSARGITEPPPWAPVRGVAALNDADLVGHLRSAQEQLASAMTEMLARPEGGVFAHAWVSTSVETGLRLMVAEQAVHRNDLLWALGDLPALSPRVVDAVLPVLRLLRGQARGAAEGDAYLFQGESFRVGWRFEAGCWSQCVEPEHFEPRGRTCVVSGADSAVCLAVYGRIPMHHPDLVISGRGEAAADFKLHFPGP